MTDNKDDLDTQFAIKRQEIDQIDAKLLQLLNQRAICAQAIGEIKMQRGDNTMYRPEREVQVLIKHMTNNQGPLPDLEVGRLFREIMSTCLALEKPLKVAYLGPEGTFTQQAALKHFGGAVLAEPCYSIDEVFRTVEANVADYGVVPIENSTEGVVNRTLDMLLNSNLLICGETQLRIHQNLITHASHLADIKMIYAHPQSLAQCRNWLDHNLPHAGREASTSNAKAAEFIQDKPQFAALGSINAAKVYDIPVFQENIEDDPSNTTRFLALGKGLITKSGKDKTSLLISANDRPGLLFHLIEPFARHGITMSHIESRPSKKDLWGYVFFIDILGHHSDENVQNALKEVKAISSQFKILGSYPSGVI